MDEIKKVLTIQTSEGERSVKSLRKEISDYRDALLNVEKDSKDWQDITKKLVKAQEDLTSVTKVNKQTVDAAKDSIVGMEREYKALYDTYKLLSEEQRKSQFGKEMATQLETLSNKLNETKKEVGNYKDNIGRYTQGVMDAFAKLGDSAKALQNPVKLASAGFTTMGNSMKALAANPVGAALLALVTIIKQVSTAIKGNEEAQMKLNEAMAAFEPIGNIIKNIFTAIGDAVVWVADKVGGLIALFSKSAAATRDLAKAANQLTRTKREYDKLNAKDEARIAQLIEEANTTDDLAKKQKLLNDAKELQAKVNERNIEVATEENRILEEKSKLTANSTADNEALTKSEINLGNAEADAAKKMKTLDTQLKSSKNNTDKVKDAAKDAAAKIKQMKDEVASMSNTIRKSHLSEIQKLQEEKQAWIEKYKAVGKASDEVEKYYNTQIDAAKKSVMKESNIGISTAFENVVAGSNEISDFSKNAVSITQGLSKSLEDAKAQAKEIAGVSGEKTAEEWLSRMTSYLKTTASNEIVAGIDSILQSVWDDIENRMPYDFKEFTQLTLDEYKTFEDEMFTNISSARLNEIGVIIPENFRDGFESVEEMLTELEDLVRINLDTAFKGYRDTIKQIADEGFPISEDDIKEVVQMGEAVVKLSEAYAQIGGYINLFPEYDDNTNGVTNAGLFSRIWFGDESTQDKNGFAILDEYEEQFGKFSNKVTKILGNSAKVWQDWGGAVNTILDAVASNGSTTSTSSWKQVTYLKVRLRNSSSR